MKIMGHYQATEFCQDKNVVIISDPKSHPYSIDIIKDKSKNFIHVEFHDIDKIVDGCIAPSLDHLEKIVEFAKQFPVDIVCCFAGVSRSSATAYIISCLTDSPENAINVLDKMRHSPNNRVVRTGAKVLNNNDVWETFRKWSEAK